MGDWRAIGNDLLMEALTPAGLFGKVTSKSAFLPPLLCLTYRGHVAGRREGHDARLCPRRPNLPFTLPVVLIVGTSMSAGKTMTARLAIRLLKEAGRRVIGAKLTGAGRYRDVLSMKDAGADLIFDFVDVGLPSTVGPADEYREALRTLLTMITGPAPMWWWRRREPRRWSRTTARRQSRRSNPTCAAWCCAPPIPTRSRA